MNKLLRILIPLALCAVVWVTALAFSDEEEIDAPYRDAVAAMTEQGVLEGFEDGSFRPEETLTREQGAKIITYLCIGREAAEALVCRQAPFDDVAADRWSAPYIAWCVEKGIINGYGNGCFGPTDALTGDHYAKMLLCALGLGREDKTAYTGPDWFKAVREDAEAAGLYDGDPAMASDKPLNRGQAALLSWNTAQAEEAAVPSPTSGSETDVEISGETGGEAGGETSGETGGEAGGEAGGEVSGESGGTSGSESGGESGGESGDEASGEAGGTSGSESGGESGGESEPSPSPAPGSQNIELPEVP